MALDATQRLDCAIRSAQEAFVRPNVTATLDSADMLIIAGAADDFIEAQAGAFNSSIPAAQRSKANLQQKTLIFALVALKRAGLI